MSSKNYKENGYGLILDLITISYLIKKNLNLFDK